MNCIDERKILEQARLAEAFDILLEALAKIKSQGIAYLVNGTLNLSRIVFEAGVTSVYPADEDYAFARFINPYSLKSSKSIAVSVDVEKGKENLTVEIVRGVFNKIERINTLLAIQTNSHFKEVKKIYDIAKESNKCVFDVTFNPSEELLRYAEAYKKVNADLLSVDDNAAFDFIRNSPVDLIDNSQKYYVAFRQLNVTDIESVALAVTLVNTNGNLNDEIMDFAMGEEVLIYQEQAIAKLSELSSCSQFFADNVRLAASKRNFNLLNEYKSAFLNGGKDVIDERFAGCIGNGCLEKGNTFWSDFCELAPYLYLKAHAVARAKFYINCAKIQILKNKQCF